MADIPQYSDPVIKFTEVGYSTEPTDIDLTALDDIIFSVTIGSPDQTPSTILKYTESPTLFSIDNVNKTVSVTLTAAQLGNSTGKHYVNLWLVSGGRYLTHLKKYVEVESVVNYRVV